LFTAKNASSNKMGLVELRRNIGEGTSGGVGKLFGHHRRRNQG
jgi:hypothetical protein